MNAVSFYQLSTHPFQVINKTDTPAKKIPIKTTSPFIHPSSTLPPPWQTERWTKARITNNEPVTHFMATTHRQKIAQPAHVLCPLTSIQLARADIKEPKTAKGREERKCLKRRSSLPMRKKENKRFTKTTHRQTTRLKNIPTLITAHHLHLWRQRLPWPCSWVWKLLKLLSFSHHHSALHCSPHSPDWHHSN